MFLIPLNISELTTSQFFFETVRLPGGTAIIFPNSAQNHSGHQFYYRETFHYPYILQVNFFSDAPF